MAKVLKVRGPHGITLDSLVDEDVWEWAQQHHWYMKNGYVCRWVNGTGYATKDYWESFLHREIMNVEREVGRRVHVHHEDENPLNNRRANLKVMTPKRHHQTHADKHVGTVTNAVTRGKMSDAASQRWVAKHGWESADERDETIWRLWCEGRTHAEIGQIVGTSAVTPQRLVSRIVALWPPEIRNRNAWKNLPLISEEWG